VALVVYAIIIAILCILFAISLKKKSQSNSNPKPADAFTNGILNLRDSPPKTRQEILNGLTSFKKTAICIFLIVLWIHYPTIVKHSIEMLFCTNIYRPESPEIVLMKDYQTQCWSSDHWVQVLAFAAPVAYLTIIFIPLLLIMVLHKNNKKITQDKHLVYHFYLLYKDYRDSKKFYEIVMTLRKLLLVLIMTFDPSNGINLIAAFYVNYMALYLHLQNKPYELEILNKLERASMICILIFNLEGILLGF